MMTDEERRNRAFQVISFFDGCNIHECLSVMTEVLGALLLAVPRQDSQHIKSAIILQNFTASMVDMMLGDTKGGTA
jgi:hypothetical protein